MNINFNLKIERLQLLYNMLIEVEEGTWKPTRIPLYMQELPVKTFFDMTVWGKKESCGYAACAYGHAIMDERFDGLQNIVNKLASTHVYAELDAAEQYFHLTETEACQLFLPSRYYKEAEKVTPLDVADKVKNMIAETKNELRTQN